MLFRLVSLQISIEIFCTMDGSNFVNSKVLFSHFYGASFFLRMLHKIHHTSHCSRWMDIKKYFLFLTSGEHHIVSDAQKSLLSYGICMSQKSKLVLPSNHFFGPFQVQTNMLFSFQKYYVIESTRFDFCGIQPT